MFVSWLGICLKNQNLPRLRWLAKFETANSFSKTLSLSSKKWRDWFSLLLFILSFTLLIFISYTKGFDQKIVLKAIEGTGKYIVIQVAIQNLPKIFCKFYYSINYLNLGDYSFCWFSCIILGATCWVLLVPSKEDCSLSLFQSKRGRKRWRHSYINKSYIVHCCWNNYKDLLKSSYVKPVHPQNITK